MTCEQIDDLLLEFVEGELPRDQTEEVRAHVRGCPKCTMRLRDTREIVGDLSAARSLDDLYHMPEDEVERKKSVDALQGRDQVGDFQIEGELGRGGMGVVYRARQVSLNRIVALKLLSLGALQTERAVARFRNEAQAAARLHHTNIVPIYAQGEDQGCFYYAMELIQGRSLAEILRRDPIHLRADADTPNGVPETHRTDTPRSRWGTESTASTTASTASGVRSAIRVLLSGTFVRPSSRPTMVYKRIARQFAEVAEALDHAHEAQIVHRDIKPQNLLLGEDDSLHITDFGLARLLDEPGVTLSFEMVGTPAYMAPEQARDRARIDGRTDQYSLGVTLYEVLARQRPFQAETYEKILDQILNREPVPPRRIDTSVPIDLETICLRAMEKEPGRRFTSAGEMARDLRRYAQDFPIASRRVGPLGKTWRWIRRHKARSIAIAAMMVVAMLVPALYRVSQQYADERIDQAYDILLDDYGESKRALAVLDRVSWMGGDRRKTMLVRALAEMRPDADAARSRLQAWVAAHPEDVEALYMLAWTCRATGRNAELRQHLQHADALLTAAPWSATGPAYFYRGQAYYHNDLDKANQSFRDAIKEHHPKRFPQAMLHRARVLNQAMYVFRKIDYFDDARASLDAVIDLQPTDPYPVYFRSIAYRLKAELRMARAEEFRTREERDRRRAEAEAAYRQALDDAEAAREMAGDGNPYPYLAAAEAYESWGLHSDDPTERDRLLGQAIAAWEIPPEALEGVSRAAMSRHAYLMRLLFWVGAYEQAETQRAARYATTVNPGSADHRPEPDAYVLEALFARCRGDDARASAALRKGASAVGDHAEPLLVLWAGYHLCGLDPPDGLLTRPVDFEKSLSTNWDAAWLRSLYDFVQGRRSWEEISDLAHRGEDRERSLAATQREAGAWYFKAAVAARDGDVAAMREALERAAKKYDLEHYCFQARLWLEKMRIERQPWPPWIYSDGAGIAAP